MRSESIAELTKALCRVQSELKGAIKDSTNPFYKQTYADLASVWDACREALGKNGLAVIQTTEAIEHGVIVETLLSHISGEWISGRLQMKPQKEDPQGIGSAITYARRYALAAIVGVCPADDDAEKTTEREKDGSPEKGKKEEKGKLSPSPTFADSMARAMSHVGTAAYFKVLGNHGYCEVSEIPTGKQNEILNELRRLPAEVRK